MSPAHRSRSTPKKKIVPTSPPLVVNPNLNRLVEAIRKLQSGGVVNAAKNQYAIGKLIEKVEDEPTKFGHTSDETVVEFLANKLKCGKDTLYNAAKLSRFWKPKEFDLLLQKKGKEDAQLTAAHFIEVLKLRDCNERDGLLEQALAENMSSRAVRRAVQVLQPVTPKAESTLSQLKKFVGNSRAALTAWHGIEALIGDAGIDEVTLIDQAAEILQRLTQLCVEKSKAVRAEVVVAPVVTSASPGPAILGASNGATPVAKLFCASDPEGGSEKPVPGPEPEGPARVPHPATPSPVSDGGSPSAKEAARVVAPVPGPVALPAKPPAKTRKLQIVDVASVPSINSVGIASGGGGL